jgi:hypothetical protein
LASLGWLRQSQDPTSLVEVVNEVGQLGTLRQSQDPTSLVEVVNEVGQLKTLRQSQDPTSLVEVVNEVGQLETLRQSQDPTSLVEVVNEVARESLATAFIDANLWARGRVASVLALSRCRSCSTSFTTPTSGAGSGLAISRLSCSTSFTTPTSGAGSEQFWRALRVLPV